jgi:hypothetical protein
MSTTLERFEGATLSLTRSVHIKERLTDAYRNYLALVEEDELPIELREEFRELSHALTREPPLLRGEDSIRATVRKMSCGEAENAAGRVVCLFAILSRVQIAGSRAKAKAAATIVPMYVAEAG